jgi:protein TonB
MILSSPQSPGIEGGDANRIYVTVVSEQERTAQDDTPDSDDSPASDPGRTESAKAEERTEKPKNEVPEPEGIEKPETTEKENGKGSPVLASNAPNPNRDRIRMEEESAGSPDGERKPDEKNELAESGKRAKEDRKKANEFQSELSLPRIASVRNRFRAARGRSLADFNSKVQAAIKEATIFPGEAAKRKIHGTTTVKFIIARDGSLVGLKVIGSSGEELLDRTALKIVRKASLKFPEIPAAIARDRLSYVVPIVFKKKRSRKRK